MRLLARYFLQGLIVLLPTVTTIWVLTGLLKWVDDLFPGIKIPGLGFVCALLTVLLVGWLASKFLGAWIVRWTEWLVARIPLVSWVYRTVKDVIEAFAGDKKTFDKPVVVTLFPNGTLKVLGFITREDLTELGLPGEVAVLLQQSLNFAGNLVVLPREQVRPVPIDAGRFFTFLMSGGLTGNLSAEPEKPAPHPSFTPS